MYKYEITYKPKMVVNCPICKRRIFDVIKGTQGTIQIKCPNCRTVSDIAVSFRLQTSHTRNHYIKRVS